MRMRSLVPALVASAVAWAGASALALDVGEKAPELDVTEWALGEPLKIADAAGKKVVLVEFWATFETDCAEVVPVLAKILDKHKAAGFDIVAVTTEPRDAVTDWLKDRSIGWRIAIDQNHNTLATWAKDVRKLPYAYLVDKTGTVVWKGDPSEGLERMLDDVMAGKFDLKKTLEIQRLRRELGAAFRQRDLDKAAGLCEQILAIEPADDNAYQNRVSLFRGKNDLEGYRKFVRTMLDRLKDDAKALGRVAWRLVVEGQPHWRDPELALVQAKRAVDMTKSADADLVDTYAYVLHEIGLLEQAIEQEKKAVALDAKNETYKNRLAFFQACLAARAKAQPPAPPPPPKKK